MAANRSRRQIACPLRLLLDRGLDPDVSSAPRRALDVAAYHGLAEIAELLLARGAMANTRNQLGERPIDLLDAYEPRPSVIPIPGEFREGCERAGRNAGHSIGGAGGRCCEGQATAGCRAYADRHEGSLAPVVFSGKVRPR